MSSGAPRSESMSNGAAVRSVTRRLREGAPLTVDSDSGRIYAGRLAVVVERPVKALATIKGWRV